MVTFGERIRKLANILGKEEQDLAKDLGLTKSQLSHYINGRRKVPSELLQKIVDIYNISPLFLFRETEQLYDVVSEEKGTYNTKTQYKYFPTYISAGLPNEVDGITEPDKIKISDEIMGKYAGNKDIFITRINGDSMNKVIPHDSLIAVRPVSPETLKNGDIVVYKFDSEYAVKRFYKQDNKVIFRPDSNDLSFTDLVIDLEHNDLDIKIKGKVVLYIVELD